MLLPAACQVDDRFCPFGRSLLASATVNAHLSLFLRNACRV